MEKEQFKKCHVDKENFVVMCEMMQRLCEDSTAKKGISYHTMMNFETGKLTRGFPVLKSGEHAKNGVALNFCPMCGEKIDGAFNAILEDKP